MIATTIVVHSHLLSVLVTCMSRFVSSTLIPKLVCRNTDLFHRLSGRNIRALSLRHACTCKVMIWWWEYEFLMLGIVPC